MWSAGNVWRGGVAARSSSSTSSSSVLSQVLSGRKSCSPSLAFVVLNRRGASAAACYGTQSSGEGRPFDKILIANRGEIACRVINTAKRLGIKTVAIYSEADAAAKHVLLADEAACVGPAPTSKSYLNIPAIMEVVKKTKAQAVHPGYGFLSENFHFAEALEGEGVAFVGPTSQAIHAMGDKIESKKLAKAAKVNVIPGFLGEVHDNQEVLKIANEIGYPIMIKASAGGGGKGMRIAWNDKEALEGFKRSKAEAQSSFGDDRMLIEKYIDNPRHIEIQVLGDSHGNYLYFPERECSIQRRNQKVIEEAPSPLLNPETRIAMGKQAVALARAVNYRSAGTVEFLADNNQNFYFLEMNTRLQVEHPITEYITGVDLVEQMLNVAAGRKLALSQEDIKIHGWALESRVYAEDPYRNFLPSIGRLTRYKEPAHKLRSSPFRLDDDEPVPARLADSPCSVRVDAGVMEGSEISTFYDPLICKLCTWGPTRDEAVQTMERALDEYVIRGVRHNIAFLRDVMDQPRFRKGALTTKFIPEEYPHGFTGHELNENEVNDLVVSAAAMQFVRREREATISGQLSEYATPPTTDTFVVTINGKDYQAKVTKQEDDTYPSPRRKLQVEIVNSGNKASVPIRFEWPVDSIAFDARVGDRDLLLQFIKALPLGLRLQYCGTEMDVLVRSLKQAELSKHMPPPKTVDHKNSLLSPMPGQVVSVSVQPGDAVSAGQELAVVEAMKMQNVLRAESDGVIETVLVKEGSNVAVDEVLLTFKK
ncbi:Propionyl-CoA carboxylase alpha chain, mitochondrial [Balamuthia mandrillaris]